MLRGAAHGASALLAPAATLLFNQACQTPALLLLQLVLDCFPERQTALLAQLAPHPDLQFAFLQSLAAIHQRQRASGDSGGSSSSSPLKARLGHAQQAAIAMPGAWPPILVAALHLSCAASFQILLSCPALLLQASRESPQLSSILADPSVATVYLRLLCRYEPRSGGKGVGALCSFTPWSVFDESSCVYSS